MLFLSTNFSGSEWEYIVQITGENQEEKHGVVHHVQVEHYQRV